MTRQPTGQIAQPEAEPTARDDGAWQLVLEFGDSRSTFYDYVVAQAQKRPTYRLLMDENRRMVHRVSFRRQDLRHFWRLWEYVQKWSSTHVYVNGEELETWKIWPYSPYLRP
ncbi:MAG: hypothetical protein D6790_13235 [Caldilineae bacterium]|nr:MAG: hypothetical protein D6790_13235 [Caldilineae bacterium]